MQRKTKFTIFPFFCAIATSLWICNAAFSQGRSRPVRLTGSMGIYLENYDRFGEPRRRPPHTARFYFRPTLYLFGMQTGLSLDLFLSTEQKYVSQQLNTVGLTPSWSWGGFSLGDFYPSFSPFTLNNLRVRGAGIRLHPGRLRFSVVAGETQKASNEKGAEAYRRTLYGLRLGVGKRGGSFLDVNLIKAQDLTGSLQPDSQLTVTPQENLVASVAGRLHLFRNRFRLSGEFAASGFTRDRRSALYDEEKVPAFVASIFQPRLSTRVDFAYTADARVELQTLSAGAGVQYIGPGYHSLGISSLFNDVKEMHADGTLRLFRNRFSLRGAYAVQWDNLLQQKRFTTQRQRGSVNLNLTPSRRFNANFSTYITTMDNHAGVDSLRMNFFSISANGSMTFSFPRGFFLQAVRLTGVYNSSDNKTRLVSSRKVESHQLGGSVQIGLPMALVFSPGASFVRTRMESGTWRWIVTYQAQVARSRPGRWTPSLNASLNDGYGGTSYRADLRLEYRISRKGRLAFNARIVKFAAEAYGGQSYLEMVSSLSYQQSF